VALRKRRIGSGWPLAIVLACLAAHYANAQDSSDTGEEAGRIPVIAGGAGYIHNVSGGAPTLEPQVDPVLLVPFGRHYLLESRTDFTGFFQRQDQTSGPFKGKVFKTVEFAQIDWLANTHAMAVGGRYLLPFGLFNERLEPIWIRNLQDAQLTAAIGTRTTGAGDGLMLRGVAVQIPAMSVQYSVYGSAHSSINQFDSARTAGVDASFFLPGPRLEIGSSWQRFLEDHHFNSGALYLSWQPPSTGLDVKAEQDLSHFGHGYWIETAYRAQRESLPQFVRSFQPVVRMQQVFPVNGGGNGLPVARTERFDFGLNYYLRDNLRLISSYGRSFSSAQNLNIWNLGLTYRFTIPLWLGGKK
jgi:hypothetical protein